MTKSDKDYSLLILALSKMNFLTIKEKFILLKKLDSIQDLAILSIEDISKIFRRHFRIFVNFENLINEAKKDLFLIEKLNISFTLYSDFDYPPLLKEISDPPFILFYRGDINVLKKYCISVVGTRKAILEASSATVDFAKDACLDGVTIVSGLAFGIDKKAHEGALEAFFENENCGKTAAILPSGIDTIMPTSHKKLAAKIINSGGVLVSEYPPTMPALPYRYVQRNRIIAGLSPITVVMQAPPGSGAMITADFALGYFREVMFHQAAFCEESLRFSKVVQNQLEYKSRQNKTVLGKLTQSPEQYVQDGARIINSYDDFCQKLNEGFYQNLRNEKTSAQLNLFE